MAKALRYAVRLCLVPVGFVLMSLIRVYQYLISPMFPPTCRFLPTCSHYAGEALRVHGPVRGSGLALWRLLRCNPWGGHGYDPVPGTASEGHDHSADASTPAMSSRRPHTIEGPIEGPVKGMS